MDKQVLKSAIADLNDRRKELHKQLDKTDDAIKALQNICEHVWLQDGHDSHKDHFICEYCGETDTY